MNRDTIAALRDALEMVRDADEDCRRDGLQTIPVPARAKIDAALAKQIKRTAFTMMMACVAGFMLGAIVFG